MGYPIGSIQVVDHYPNLGVICANGLSVADVNLYMADARLVGVGVEHHVAGLEVGAADSLAQANVAGRAATPKIDARLAIDPPGKP